jgi:hypothetical protein
VTTAAGLRELPIREEVAAVVAAPASVAAAPEPATAVAPTGPVRPGDAPLRRPTKTPVARE